MSDVRMSPYELFGLPETYVLDETLLAERHLLLRSVRKALN